MSHFQRIKAVISGVLLLLFALILLVLPEDYYSILAFIISIMLIVYGLRQLIYYLKMARHMVGGKIILYKAIIILDLGLFTSSLYDDHSVTILIYLLAIYAFTGFVDILRAFEAKNTGSKTWKRKLIFGIIMVVFALVLVVLGMIMQDVPILVIGFCISLVFIAARKFSAAFRKTAIVYIQ